MKVRWFQAAVIVRAGRTGWWVVKEWRPMCILGVGMCSRCWPSIFQSIQYLKDIFLCIKIHSYLIEFALHFLFFVFASFLYSLTPFHSSFFRIFFSFSFYLNFFPVLWNPIYFLNSPSPTFWIILLFLPQAFSQQFILLSPTMETWLYKSISRYMFPYTLKNKKSDHFALNSEPPIDFPASLATILQVFTMFRLCKDEFIL